MNGLKMAVTSLWYWINMTAMVRPKGMGKRVAYAILGVPANMKELRKTKKEKHIDSLLKYDETQRVR